MSWNPNSSPCSVARIQATEGRFLEPPASLLGFFLVGHGGLFIPTCSWELLVEDQSNRDIGLA